MCPQGSDLGPLLFGMYTTPLSTLIFSSLNHITSTYVDDTDQLFLSFLVYVVELMIGLKTI